MTKNQKEENIQNKIKEVVDSFAEMERDSNGKHLWASIEPKKNEIHNSRFKHFDNLARFFTTSQEDHIATYYNGEKLMIASSKAEPKAAREALKALSEFAITPSLEKYKELVKLAIKNIYLRIEKNAKNLTLSEERIDNVFKSFKSLIAEYQEKIIENQEELTQERLVKMKNCVQELFNEIKELENSKSETRDFVWDCLVPFDDVNIITNAIQEKGFFKELLDSIKNPGELVDFVEGEEGMHPEMKIINKLCQTGFKPEFPYLGSSKLTCMPCHFSVMVLNETRFDGSLLMAGTHGSTYPNWIVPTNFSSSEKQKILEKIESCRHRFSLRLMEALIRQD